MDFSESLVSKDVEVYIFSGGIYGNYPWKNLNIYPRSVMHLPSGPLPNPKLYLDLLRGKHDISIFLGAEPFAGLCAYFLSGLRKKKRLVIIEENAPLRSFSWYLKRPFVNMMYHGADRLVAESSASKLYVQRLFNIPEKRIEVLPHGIKLTRFHVCETVNRFLKEKPKGKFVLLFPGELSHVKGADDLIGALEILASTNPDNIVVWLRLSGPLLYEKSFASKLKSLLKIGIVKEFPNTPYDDMPLLYAASDAILVPSALMNHQSSDRSPNALLEGLASGRPTIATPVGGIPTMAGLAVLYVEPNNPHSLAQGIKLLINDAELRAELSAKSIKQATALDMDFYAKRFTEIINDILNN